jgi:sugar-specific transcriptional regulator TrmB
MDEIVKNLEKLGFTSYESKVFCVLFEGHLLTASDIAKKANIPRSSAYDILKAFVKQGICNEIQTSSVAKYEIIDPAIVQDKIEKEIHDTYKSRMSNLKFSFDKLQPIFRAKEMEGQKVDVELIKGFNKHRFAKFMEIFRNAEKEILLMSKPEGYLEAEVDKATEEFLKKGGVLKTLYDAGSDLKIRIDGEWKNITKENFPDFVHHMALEGEEIRLTNNINQFMMICDRKIVLISLVDPTLSRYNRSDIIIKNENHASSMADYFFSQWEKALTVEEYKKQSGGTKK